MDTTALRFLAALLIANSHLEAFYPIRQFAADGLIGNSLFFLLSGLGLALSERKSRRGFPEWYVRRLLRIYPSVFLVVSAHYLLGGWPAEDRSLPRLLTRYIWPTPYAFVAQITVFYLAFFCLLKWRRERAFFHLALALCLVDLAVILCSPEDGRIHRLHWIFYFQMMLFGGALGQWTDRLRSGRGQDLLALAGLMGAYGALKYANTTGHLVRLSFLVQLLVVPIAYELIKLSQSSFVTGRLARGDLPARSVRLIAGMTLEIYLVHYLVLENRAIATLVFPVNLLAFWLATLLMASALSWASARLQSGARDLASLGKRTPFETSDPSVSS